MKTRKEIINQAMNTNKKIGLEERELYNMIELAIIEQTNEIIKLIEDAKTIGDLTNTGREPSHELIDKQELLKKIKGAGE
jgi:hypothetical protein